jgi:uncharacterized membrane protein YphA (DoxX/SURF4 family)
MTALLVVLGVALILGVLWRPASLLFTRFTGTRIVAVRKPTVQSDIDREIRHDNNAN